MHRRASAIQVQHRPRPIVTREPERLDAMHHLQRAAGNSAVQRLVTELSVARFGEGEATQLPQSDAPRQDPTAPTGSGLQAGEQGESQRQDPPEEGEQAPSSGLEHHVIRWGWTGKAETFVSTSGGLTEEMTDRLNELGSTLAPNPLQAGEVDRREGQLTLDFIHTRSGPDSKPDITINPNPDLLFALNRNKWGLRVLLAQDPGEDAPAEGDSQDRATPGRDIDEDAPQFSGPSD